MTADITFRELLDYSAGEHERWRQWFTPRGALLDQPFAEPPIATVRQLVRHIAFVEHRYAALILGHAPPAPAGSDADDVAALFAYVTEGRAALQRTIAQAAERGLETMVEFMTLSAGLQRASARKMIAHALMHGTRHWAQLATVLRAQGERTDWSHDLLMSAAMK